MSGEAIMEINIAENLHIIQDRINKAVQSLNNDGSHAHVRLVAVSKTKTIENIIVAYNAGQRHFGENYVQELEEKSHSELILKNCPDIAWHFIGHLQSNKAKKVASSPNLYLIETVDSIKLADLLNSHMSSVNKCLNIFIQVNTSCEKQKSGVLPEDLENIYTHITNNCSNLKVLGLMTIGSYEASTNPNEINADFTKLIECRNNLAKNMQLDPKSLELSMGMSHDFEQAAAQMLELEVLYLAADRFVDIFVQTFDYLVRNYIPFRNNFN